MDEEMRKGGWSKSLCSGGWTILSSHVSHSVGSGCSSSVFGLKTVFAVPRRCTLPLLMPSSIF